MGQTLNLSIEVLFDLPHNNPTNVYGKRQYDLTDNRFWVVLYPCSSKPKLHA